MPRYLDEEKVKHTVNEYVDRTGIDTFTKEDIFDFLFETDTADVQEVKHGHWETSPHAFYRDTFDETRELSVYIVANCSKCRARHEPYQVYSRTLFVPDGEDEYKYEWDLDKEKENALIDFEGQNYAFMKYCPHCGSKMDGEDEK